MRALRARAAAGEAVRVGRPAVGWLKRFGLPRAGAVDQPYLTPRLVMRGRRVSGRRKTEGENWEEAHSRGSRGGMVVVVM